MYSLTPILNISADPFGVIRRVRCVVSCNARGCLRKVGWGARLASASGSPGPTN